MENKTIGTIISVKKQWWLKVNTKPVRMHALDGATFPHIVTVKYTVDGNEIVKKKWLMTQTGAKKHLTTVSPPWSGALISDFRKFIDVGHGAVAELVYNLAVGKDFLLELVEFFAVLAADIIGRILQLGFLEGDLQPQTQVVASARAVSSAGVAAAKAAAIPAASPEARTAC